MPLPDLEKDDLNAFKETESPKEKEEETKEEIKQDEEKKEEQEVRFDRGKIRIFLIKLAKAAKRHELRLQARKDFHEHVDKIRENVKVPKRYNFDSDIDELKKKVAHLISIESNPQHHMHNKYVQERILILENKLNKVLQAKEEREKRFQELENKISTKMDADQRMIRELEKKILLLQKKIIENKMKKKSKNRISELNDLKERLELTQDALEKVKKQET